MKCYIILIPLIDNRDARSQCETIENHKFNLSEFQCDTVRANHVKGKVIELLGGGINDFTTIEVEPITDFMDRCNDSEFNSDNYFMSYVYA